MALTYGFYNSIEGDRVYDAIQFGRIFDGIIKDGVYATYEKGMMVIASSNPAEVIIQPGRAWFNHTWSYNDANVIFEAPAPEVLLERYDALVLEINEELSSRENSFKWVTGTPSSRPERPTLTNTSTIHQYPLCYVHRYPETTMIYKRDITNAIGTSECPFATGVLEGIDLDAWINQWDDEFHNWENTTKTGFETWMLNQEQVYTAWFNSMHSQMDTDLADFEAWFQTIQGIIDEDAALHLQQEIDELRQEATSGSRIFIHTINQSLFGKNVTITEAGGTVFTSRFDNTGVAEFKSVPYVGNLTISSTDGIQTATSVVNTPYYARYNFTIAFWAATVNIVGDPEMSGSTVTVRDSNEVLVGTVVLDSAGTGVFTATAPDTYKFILTYGGETMEVTLSVTQETTYTVDLHAAGFKWQDWLEAGGVTGSYSSLDDVLADEVALRRLFTVHASVDYMAGINKENDDVEKIIGTDLAAKWINLRDYALDTLYANTIIKGYMDTADKYFYGEWALMPQVPTMTSNTAPYGEAFASSTYSDRSPYRVFDNNSATQWTSNENDYTNAYIGYKSAQPICVKEVDVKSFLFTSYADTIINAKIQGSNDNINWTDIKDVPNLVVTSQSASVTTKIKATDNKNSYLYHRLKFVSKVSGSSPVSPTIGELQFYAWQPKGNVPVMTSNTAPYGEVVITNQYQTNYGYYSFNGDFFNGGGVSNGGSDQYIGYKFVTPVNVRRIKLIDPDTTSSGQYPETIKLQYSDDGVTWYDTTTTYQNTFSGVVKEVYLNVNDYGYHLYWIIRSTSNTSYYTRYTHYQFYGRELSVSVPVMTGNTTPYGEAFANPLQQDAGNYHYQPWNSFDGVISEIENGWYATTANAYVGYDFGRKVLVKKVVLTSIISTRAFTFKIQGSNDNFTSDIHDLSDVITKDTTATTIYNIDLDNSMEYRYYRLIVLSITSTYANVHEIQFYGLDYSEKEFEEGTTKKWLYDHGVELETINIVGTVTKGTDAIQLTAANSYMYAYNINLAPYNVFRGKVGNHASGSNQLKVWDNVASSLFSASNMPYNNGIDASSITTSNSVGVLQTANGIFDATELWLE